MDFRMVQSLADHPVWRDGEKSRLVYGWPLYRFPWQDGFWAWSWKSLVERRGLLRGAPREDLVVRNGCWVDRSPQSHIGPYLHAMDVIVPVGTTVVSAQSGRIIEVVESHDQYGNDPRYEESLNHMTVEVDGGNGEFVQYCHVARGSVSQRGLAAGSRIAMGQPIGLVGLNGWTTGIPHLHILVFQRDQRPENPFGFKSLAVRFRR